jgi:hypothetical protein
MDATISPATAGFLRWVGDTRVFGQIHLARIPGGHEFRHADDRARPAAGLRAVGIAELRGVSRRDATGGFRPLKGAPTLSAGWRCEVLSAADFEAAMEHLYPGGLADWHAVAGGVAVPTGFREFTGRQTGIYASVRELDDTGAAGVVRATCGVGRCLKRRLWEAPGLPADGAGKSDLPCLEPCAVLLDAARRAARDRRRGGEIGGIAVASGET